MIKGNVYFWLFSVVFGVISSMYLFINVGSNSEKKKLALKDVEFKVVHETNLIELKWKKSVLFLLGTVEMDKILMKIKEYWQ